MSFDKLTVINDSIASREAEIGMYEINIFNYEAILASLIDPIEDADLEAYRSQIVSLLASEKREKAKSELVLQALNAQLISLSQQ